MIIDRTFFSGEDYKHTFTLMTFEGHIHFGADSEEERLDWIDYLSNTIFNPFQNDDPILLPEEVILQEVHCCSFACTGKQLPLYNNSIISGRGNSSSRKQKKHTQIYSASGSVIAGVHSNITTKNSGWTNSITPTRRLSSVGKQELSTKTTGHTGEAYIKITNTKQNLEREEPLKVVLWITSYRILIRYKSRNIINLNSLGRESRDYDDDDNNNNITNDDNIDEKITYISISLDSIYKIFLQNDNSKSSSSSIGINSIKHLKSPTSPPSRQKMILYCRDFRCIEFGFDYQTYPEHTFSVKMLMELLTHKVASRCHSISFIKPLPPLIPPQEMINLDGTVPKKEEISPFIEKFYYNQDKEMERLKISKKIWRKSHELSIQSSNRIISGRRLLFSTPSIVPSNINESTIKKACQIRKGGLSPILNWKNPKKENTYIFSCLRRSQSIFKKSSQTSSSSSLQTSPKLNDSKYTDLTTTTTTLKNVNSSSIKANAKAKLPVTPWEMEQYINADQEVICKLNELCKPTQLQFINLINKELSDNNPMLFVDEIKYLQNTGCSLNNIIIPTQKDIKLSFQNLYDIIINEDTSSISPNKIIDKIENCKWMQYNNQFLNTSFDILQVIEKDQSIVLQADSSEYFSLIIIQSIVQLLVDPFYRTLSGFCILLQKEWFNNIIYHASPSIISLQKKLNQDDPFFIPFIQFLDLVWQITEMFPRSFEFNHKFLFFLSDSLNCGTLFFRLNIAYGEHYQLGHNLYSRLKKNTIYNIKKDPKNENTSHPLLYPGNSPTIWDIIANFKFEFLNSLFMRNHKLRHSILSLSTSFHLNCWFPYYLRYYQWKNTLQFYQSYDNIQIRAGRDKTSIDLRGLGLSCIPLEAEHLIHLRDINFSYNHLTSIPNFLSILPCLTILSLEGNFISSLFEDKMILPDTLLVLNLNYNRIRILPSSIKKLTSKNNNF